MNDIYGSMQFFVLYPNMTSKTEKKMWNMIKYEKYSNQGGKVGKWASISRLWPTKINP